MIWTSGEAGGALLSLANDPHCRLFPSQDWLALLHFGEGTLVVVLQSGQWPG